MESIEFFNNINNCYKGKNVLITGATGGIGQAVTLALVELGANVIVTSRTEKKVIEKLGNCVKKPNFDKQIINFEVPSQIKSGFTQIMQKFVGRLDIVIICHAKFMVGKIIETNMNDFDNCLNINVRSCFHLISMSAPFLKLSQGNVVVCSSMESMIPVNDSFLNSISKSMLNSLIQCSALELAPFGVRVNGVAPGMTNTEFRVTDVFDKKENKVYLEKMADYFLLNKAVIEPNDIANAILFLASEDAKFMTGEILPVDNGYSLNHDLSFNPGDE